MRKCRNYYFKIFTYQSKILNKTQEIANSGICKTTNNLFKIQNLNATESAPLNVESPINLNNKFKSKTNETKLRKDSKETRGRDLDDYVKL